MDRLQIVVLACGLAACNKPSLTPLQPQAATTVRAAIDSQVGRLFDAYRHKDGAAFAALYFPNAVMVSPQGTLAGRSAIQEDMSQGLSNVASVTDDSMTTEEFILANDRAIQFGHLTWHETGKNNKAQRVMLQFVFVWARDTDGAWRIQRDNDYELMKPTT